MNSLGPTISGPAFLALYALFALLVIVVVKFSLGREPAGPVPLVDPSRDPFEVAYLRGAENELVRFAIFELVRNQALRLEPAGRSKEAGTLRATGFVSGPGPPELLDAIVEYCATPRPSSDFFRSRLPSVARGIGERLYRPRLIAEGLLTAPERRMKAQRNAVAGALVLTGGAGARLFQAHLAHHRNVVFLIVEAVVACLVLLAVTQTRRVSFRGRLYLDRLKTALRPAPSGVASAAAGLTALPLFVAATGFTALADTPYASMGLLFRRSAAGGDSGGCGSSVDSGGSCSSSSCGGGSGCGG